MDESFLTNLKENAINSGIERFVVGAVIAQNSKILLLKRSQDDFMGGILELPSGKVENSESLDVALAREVKEETNLELIEILKYLGYFDYSSKSGKKTRQFNFVITVKEPFNIKLSEHDGFVWLAISEINNCNVTKSVKEIIRLYWSSC